MGVGACSGVSFTFSCTLSIEEHVTYYFTAQQIPSGLGVIANTLPVVNGNKFRALALGVCKKRI